MNGGCAYPPYDDYFLKLKLMAVDAARGNENEFKVNESMGLDGSLNLNEKVNARAQPCQKQ